MSQKLHLIYIPGLGDTSVAGQRRAVSTWRWYGVNAELFQMNWADDVAWPVKFGKLLARIDALASEGKQVGLVGASAGASVCINALAARPDKIVGVVSIAGKINHPETIGQKYRTANPSFIDSAYAASKALKDLRPEQRRRILSIYSVMDGLLMRRDSRVPGARNRLTLIMGHPFVIGAQITLGAPGFICVLKRQIQRQIVT
jgi:pimeloyl-ACP methyl ester carboxylesterase